MGVEIPEKLQVGSKRRATSSIVRQGPFQRKRHAFHRVAARPRQTRKNLHHPFVYHALFLRCNLPAHYSSVYQRFRAPQPPSPLARRFCLCVFLSIYSRVLRHFIRDVPPLPVSLSLRFAGIYSRHWSEFIAHEFFLPPQVAVKGRSWFSMGLGTNRFQWTLKTFAASFVSFCYRIFFKSFLEWILLDIRSHSRFDLIFEIARSVFWRSYSLRRWRFSISNFFSMISILVEN